jgi:hypothetical protein
MLQVLIRLHVNYGYYVTSSIFDAVGRESLKSNSV